jgi:hypothetical protein
VLFPQPGKFPQPVDSEDRVLKGHSCSRLEHGAKTRLFPQNFCDIAVFATFAGAFVCRFAHARKSGREIPHHKETLNQTEKVT